MRVINGIIVRVYNWVISRKVLKSGGKVTTRIRQILFHNICYQCNATFGNKNPDRLFYVIRCPQDTMGFFGVYNYVVSHIKKAEEMRAEPVVDWKYYPNGATTTNDSIGKENTWDWFFEPICDVDIEEVYHSKNVIMSDGNNYASLGELKVADEIRRSHIIIERYIKLKKVLKKEIEEWENQYDFDKALGVLARGTIFITDRPSDHTTIPTTDDLIAFIKKIENINGSYKNIFLATEDENIKIKLKNEFGMRLIYSQEKNIERIGDHWSNELFYLAENKQYDSLKIEIAKQYLISICILSRCRDLIAPPVGGTLGAARIKGGYSNMYLVNADI